MKFDDLDQTMRVFETAHDHCVLPAVYIVARLDGRGFTKLTKEAQDFEAPFDRRFHELMVNTTRHLMDVGFRVVYGFTQSDEISLLVSRDCDAFGRKIRKINSVLAGEASARFSLDLGASGTFDCRVSQLPNATLVADYFRWRSEDAHRNALHGHCYWALRREGLSAQQATAKLSGRSTAEKNELLFQHGINFNDLPTWQKRGTGVYWETYEKQGENPLTGERTMTERRRLVTDEEIPFGEPYNEFVKAFAATGS